MPSIDIIGQILNPIGNPVGEEFLAAQRTAGNDSGHFDAAALEDGRFVVVFEDDPGTPTGIVLRSTEWQTDDNGVTVQTTSLLAGPPGGGASVRLPSVAAQDDGSYMAAYLDTQDMTVQVVPVAADGTAGAARAALDNLRYTFVPTDIAALADGGYVVTYDSDDFFEDGSLAEDVSIVFRMLDGNGAFVSDQKIVDVTGYDGEDNSGPTVTGLAWGGFVVAWTDPMDSPYNPYSYVKLQVFSEAGYSIGIPRVVARFSGLFSVDYDPEIFALADSSFVVAYNSFQDGVIAMQRFTRNGSLMGEEVIAFHGQETHVSGVGLADGRFFLGFAGSRNVYGQVFDPRDAPSTRGIYGPDQWVIGTPGDDTIVSRIGVEFTYGWAGDDEIIAATTPGLYHGDAGDDTIRVVSDLDGDVYDGGAGIDTIDWSAAMVEGGIFDLQAGTAGDGLEVEVMSGFENLLGTGAADTILGTRGPNRLEGRGGADRLEGGRGRDRLEGGTHDDTLKGDRGDDFIDGGSGYDTAVFSGSYAGHAIDLEAGFATGYLGNDTLANVEHVFGSSGPDEITGTETHGNRLEGSNGNDTIYGLDGRDTILGGNSDDRLYGGDDVDRLYGGAQDDFLDGGGATDFLEGGAGADTFVLRSIDDTGVGRYKRDEIRDFDAAEGDVINVFLVDADATTAGNQAFTYAGTSFTGTAGELILNDYVLSGVDVTIASMDVDGDAVIDGQLYIVGGAVIGDFVL
ncbi:calcium-binding protein [Salipiger mucosus]|uniref:calcium-binding protein n=1 Tax=Salipiger mucosus TaxID=263378 RepID=UPI0012EC3F26|nr:calcium-binding protein [Salipiger mucosus]